MAALFNQYTIFWFVRQGVTARHDTDESYSNYCKKNHYLCLLTYIFEKLIIFPQMTKITKTQDIEKTYTYFNIYLLVHYI